MRGQNGSFRLFIDDIVGIDVLVALLRVELLYSEYAKRTRELVCFFIEVGAFFTRSRDDERCTSLVDEDRVDLVNDCKIMSALDHTLFIGDHIIS